MKIAILTLPLHTNYGGILQCYALMEFIKKNKHEVVLIDRDFNKNFRIGNLIHKIIFEKIISLKVNKFIDKNIYPKTKKIQLKVETNSRIQIWIYWLLEVIRFGEWNISKRCTGNIF